MENLVGMDNNKITNNINFARVLVILGIINNCSIMELGYYLTYIDLLTKNNETTNSIKASSSMVKNFLSLKYVLNLMFEKGFLVISESRIFLSIDGKYALKLFKISMPDFYDEINCKLNNITDIKLRTINLLNDYNKKRIEEMVYGN